MSDKQKILFFEIGEGNFAREAQEEFEKALVLASRHHIKVPLKIQITILPPKIMPGVQTRLGELEYQITPVVVKTKSARYQTRLNGDGLIVGEGKDILEVLQEELRFPEDEKTVSFTSVKKEVN